MTLLKYLNPKNGNEYKELFFLTENEYKIIIVYTILLGIVSSITCREMTEYKQSNL